MIGLDPERIARVCTELGAPAYTPSQILDWIYKRRVTDFDGMSNISKKTRADLSTRFDLSPLNCVETFESIDPVTELIADISRNLILIEDFNKETTRSIDKIVSKLFI